MDGEGIRYELVHFLGAVRNGNAYQEIPREVTKAIATVMKQFADGKITRL